MRNPFLPRHGTVLLAAWCALTGSLPQTGGAEPQTDGTAANAQAETPRFQYLGAATCARCHRAPTPEDRESGVTDFVALTEYTTWDTEDRHRLAYEVLTASPQTRIMEKLLGIDAKTDARCLACHVGMPDPRVGTRQLARGVSCEACHGPSSDWIDPHWKTGWREMAPEDKAKRYGMFDVRDPVQKIELCLSCHLGSLAPGQPVRLITHEMYAAGHPPLPSFEIQTFLKQMPSHWRHASQKPPEVQRQLHYQPEPFHETKSLLLGSVITMRGSLQLLSVRADQSVAGTQSWPELALYDCRACHHDLRTPSWRQERGYLLTPGRPTLRHWTLGLLDLAVAQCDQGQPEWPEMSEPIFAALGQRPFGKAEEVGQASDEVARQLAAIIATLQGTRFESSSATAILREICRRGSAKPTDYDSARQWAWALRVVYGELDPKPPQHAEIEAVLSKLHGELRLDLAAQDPQPATSELTNSLRVAAEYDAAGFQVALTRLALLLETP